MPWYPKLRQTWVHFLSLQGGYLFWYRGRPVLMLWEAELVGLAFAYRKEAFYNTCTSRSSAGTSDCRWVSSVLENENIEKLQNIQMWLDGFCKDGLTVEVNCMTSCWHIIWLSQKNATIIIFWRKGYFETHACSIEIDWKKGETGQYARCRIGKKSRCAGSCAASKWAHPILAENAGTSQIVWRGKKCRHGRFLARYKWKVYVLIPSFG